MIFGGKPSTLIRQAQPSLWAAALALWALPAFASDPEPAGVAWDRLVFAAESGGTRVRAEVSLGPAGDLDALIPAPGGLEAAGEPARLLSATVRQSGGLAGRSKWHGRVWFRPRGAVALQRLRHKLGDEPTVKIYRYAADGVQRRRARPKTDGEAKRPPTAWRKAKTKVFPYPPEGAGCAAVTDPFLLLYIASAAAPPPDGAPRELCVFNKKTLYRVTLQGRGTERLEPGHVETRPNGETVRREQGVEARKLLMTARPLGGEPEPFEFFELRGDITLLLDPRSRLPLRIRGKARFVGQAEFALTEARVTRSP